MEKFYDEKELADILQRTKKVIDLAHLQTKMKYGLEQANRAVYGFFMDCDANYFTGSDNRAKVNEIAYHPNEFYQILFDYAISSMILDDNNQCSFTLDDVKAYTNTEDENLNYDPNHITKIAAVGAAWNPYWFNNVISCNKKLKDSLVRAFISGRYTEGRKKELDNVTPSKLIIFSNGKKMFINKDKLNRDIDNMNRDDEITYYDPTNLTKKTDYTR